MRVKDVVIACLGLNSSPPPPVAELVASGEFFCREAAMLVCVSIMILQKSFVRFSLWKVTVTSRAGVANVEVGSGFGYGPKAQMFLSTPCVIPWDTLWETS